MRLDFRFKYFQMLVHARGHAAQFAVDAVDDRKRPPGRRRGPRRQHVEKSHHGQFHRSTQNSQPAPQPPLEPFHFALVGFVVESGQMDHSVQNQNAHFRRQARENRRALRRAVSGEMAMSPTYFARSR